MKNHYLISSLILTTLVLLATGCQKEKLDYPELVDGATFNQYIPELATSVVFEYNNDYKGTHILSTPRSSVPIYGRYDGTVWHVITSASTIYANPRCDKMFYKRSKLTSIDFGDGFNTSNVVSMTRVVDTAYSGVPSIRVRFGMFAGCSNLTSLDLSVFNTSQVTDMRGLFENCSKLTSLNVSSFNTSNVEYMDAMFLGCSSLTSLDLSNFNTSNVVTMGYPFTESHSGYHGEGHHPTPPSGMFAYCHSLTSLNLSSFNTSKVTNMYTMFFECINMTHLDLSNFEVSQTSLNSVFAGINGKWFAVVSGACTIICTEATQARLEPLIPPDVVVTWERP